VTKIKKRKIRFYIYRPHRMHCIYAAYCYRWSSVVCVRDWVLITLVCPAKTVKPTKTQFLGVDLWGPRNHVLDGGAHWRQLANKMDRSLWRRRCDLLSSYIDNLFALIANRTLMQNVAGNVQERQNV